jgi:hypothetical protein
MSVRGCIKGSHAVTPPRRSRGSHAGTWQNNELHDELAKLSFLLSSLHRTRRRMKGWDKLSLGPSFCFDATQDKELHEELEKLTPGSGSSQYMYQLGGGCRVVLGGAAKQPIHIASWGESVAAFEG